jgi:hypothetical protein
MLASRVEGGVVVVALAFGLVLLALVYALGGVLAAVVLPLVLGEGWRYRARVDSPAASGAERRTDQ